jgi:hypothetical protein
MDLVGPKRHAKYSWEEVRDFCGEKQALKKAMDNAHLKLMLGALANLIKFLKEGGADINGFKEFKALGKKHYGNGSHPSMLRVICIFFLFHFIHVFLMCYL